jgi:hypothetical protein
VDHPSQRAGLEQSGPSISASWSRTKRTSSSSGSGSPYDFEDEVMSGDSILKKNGEKTKKKKQSNKRKNLPSIIWGKCQNKSIELHFLIIFKMEG